jgi:hypothetical protein
VERLRNSPVMHERVPEVYKPALFVNGLAVSFPAPTRRIRAPRGRRSGTAADSGLAPRPWAGVAACHFAH